MRSVVRYLRFASWPCPDVARNVVTVRRLGAGITKTASVIRYRGMSAVAKRVTASSRDHATRMGHYKLLKEAHLLKALASDFPTASLSWYATCLFSEDSSHPDFSTGLTVFTALGTSSRAATPDQWRRMLRRHAKTSIGMIEMTDIKFEQFVMYNNEVHMADLDDVFVHANNSNPKMFASTQCQRLANALKRAVC